MSELTSRLFTEADPATVRKLEDCALGRPNEVVSHFTLGDRGEHIKRVQQALKHVQQLEPGLGIPEFAVNGVYDAVFAEAVSVYKEKRDIRNYANKIDKIVGVKTIRSLDSDATKRSREEPPPRPKKPNEVPRPLPNCVPEAGCPVSRKFEVTLLLGASGGEVAEFTKMWFTLRDTENGLSALYLFKGGGVGTPSPLPGTFADGGGPKAFETDPVRVTRFGPVAAIGGAVSPPLLPTPVVVSATFLTLQYRPDGGGLHMTTPMKIDTGNINIPGANIHGAHFDTLTTCRGTPGAVRRVITRKDLVF